MKFNQEQLLSVFHLKLKRESMFLFLMLYLVLSLHKKWGRFLYLDFIHFSKYPCTLCTPTCTPTYVLVLLVLCLDYCYAKYSVKATVSFYTLFYREPVAFG